MLSIDGFLQKLEAKYGLEPALAAKILAQIHPRDAKVAANWWRDCYGLNDLELLPKNILAVMNFPEIFPTDMSVESRMAIVRATGKHFELLQGLSIDGPTFAAIAPKCTITTSGDLRETGFSVKVYYNGKYLCEIKKVSSSAYIAVVAAVGDPSSVACYMNERSTCCDYVVSFLEKIVCCTTKNRHYWKIYYLAFYMQYNKELPSPEKLDLSDFRNDTFTVTADTWQQAWHLYEQVCTHELRGVTIDVNPYAVDYSQALAVCKSMVPAFSSAITIGGKKSSIYTFQNPYGQAARTAFALKLFAEHRYDLLALHLDPAHRSSVEVNLGDLEKIDPPMLEWQIVRDLLRLAGGIDEDEKFATLCETVRGI